MPLSILSSLRRLARLLLPMCALAAVPASAAELTVSAAASLANAFTDIKALFELAHPGVTVNLNFAASGPLLAQILKGAPADVFASADEVTMDKAAQAGVLDTATRHDFARNDLVLIVPKGETKPAALADLADSARFGRLAIGAPESVPAGRYARDALSSAGLWEALTPAFIQAANVRQTLDYVARGEADAGFVYGTDARQMAGKVDVAFIVEGHAPVCYPVAVIADTAHPKEAAAFVDFLLSPQGQAVLARYGFAKP